MNGKLMALRLGNSYNPYYVNCKSTNVWLVKFITDEDGGEAFNDHWHLVQTHGDAPRAVCSGEVFGFGESGAEYKDKHKGRVTCPKCIEIVKWFKAVRL